MSSGKKKAGLSKMAAHVGPNMTPMVDIVMCILIFFMLGSSFIVPEMFLTSNMAVDQKGLGTEKGVASIPAVRVQISLTRTPNLETLVTAFQKTMEVGNTTSEEAEKDPVKRKTEQDKNEGLAQFFDARRREMSQDVQIIIAPTNSVPYQDVISVYDACMKARFAKVAFRQAG